MRKRRRKNLNSDDHFDRSFAFVAMEGKNEIKKNHNFTVNKSG